MRNSRGHSGPEPQRPALDHGDQRRRFTADQPLTGGPARTDYQVLSELIGEASGKGVLRIMHAKYSPEAYEAIIGPILREIGRRAPIKSTRTDWLDI